ncbi:MAG: O-antigen ligase family protein [Rhizobiales bacterium]|nr:O-antigen ligase family protein [Hyphomicrobiales bacterium]
MVSIAAFAVAAACLTTLLQRKTEPNASRPYLHLFLFVLGCTSGFLAGGKTGAIGGGMAVALMLLLGRRFRLWFGMVMITGLGYLLFDLVLRDLQIGLFAHWQAYNFERLQTVNSRFDLWLGAIKVWSDSVTTAFFGRGFTAFRTAPISSAAGWDPGHAHNSFINLLLDVGFVGALLFLTMLYCAVKGAVSMAARQGRAFSESAAFPVTITLVALLVGSLTDDVFGGTIQPTTYLFFGSVIALDRLAYLSRAGTERTHRTARLEPGQSPVAGQ